jgi:hypothetical protein
VFVAFKNFTINIRNNALENWLSASYLEDSLHLHWSHNYNYNTFINMSSKTLFGLFNDNSHKTKTSNGSADNDSFETGRRRMSVSRSGRFKEHKRRGLVTENTFTGLPSDIQTSTGPNCSEDQPVSVEKNSEVTIAHISLYSASELQNQHQGNVNDATTSVSQMEETPRIITAIGKRETLV